MASAALKTEPYVAPEEYLALERQARFKHEYIDGRVVAMAGATFAHNQIVANLAAALHAQLRRRPCQVVPSDLRVAVDRSRYTYPDLSIICGSPEFVEGTFDTLTNPTVLIEVLSPSTEAADRGEKFARARRMPSLRAYVLVSQDRMQVEVFARRDPDLWVLTEAEGPEGVLRLESAGCAVPLADIYERVAFPAPEPDAEAPPTDADASPTLSE